MRHTITLDNLELEYYEVGEGEPLLIIPGSFASWRLFQPFFSRLAKKYRVICLTLPGMGTSNSFNKVPKFGDYYQITVKLINQLIPNQQLTILGHSLGAGIALALCNQPEIVLKNVVVINPLLNPFHSLVVQPVVGFLHMIYRQVLFFPKLPFKQWFPIDMLNMAFRRPVEFVRLHLFITRFQGFKLSARQQPQMTLYYDTSDKFVMPDYEQQITSAFPNCQVKTSQHLGHNNFLYQSEEFLKALGV